MSQDLSNTRKLIATAMLIALCVVLPIGFHSIPRAGSILLPMHIPVLLAGLICGWKFGLITGMVGPILSTMMTGMPPTMLIAASMSIELGVYGLVAGLVVKFVHTKRASVDLYIALVVAMLVGRVAGGLAQVFFFFGGEFNLQFWTTNYTWAMWTTSYFVTSLPGIVIQLAFVPSVVMALERERIIPLRYPVRAN